MSELEEVIKILERARFFITDDSDTVWTKYNSGTEFQKEIDHWIERLRAEDMTVLKDIELAFYPTASFQEHAVSNGWGEEYLDLSKQIDEYLLKLQIPSIDKPSLSIDQSIPFSGDSNLLYNKPIKISGLTFSGTMDAVWILRGICLLTGVLQSCVSHCK